RPGRPGSEAAPGLGRGRFRAGPGSLRAASARGGAAPEPGQRERGRDGETEPVTESGSRAGRAGAGLASGVRRQASGADALQAVNVLAGPAGLARLTGRLLVRGGGRRLLVPVLAGRAGVLLCRRVRTASARLPGCLLLLQALLDALRALEEGEGVQVAGVHLLASPAGVRELHARHVPYEVEGVDEAREGLTGVGADDLTG